MYICTMEERDDDIQEILGAHPVMVMSLKKLFYFCYPLISKPVNSNGFAPTLCLCYR